MIKNALRTSQALAAVQALVAGAVANSDVAAVRAGGRILIKGTGTRVHQFKLDGKTQRKPFFPASSKGPHELEVLMR
jgi:hypothetical protein